MASSESWVAGLRYTQISDDYGEKEREIEKKSTKPNTQSQRKKKETREEKRRFNNSRSSFREYTREREKKRNREIITRNASRSTTDRFAPQSLSIDSVNQRGNEKRESKGKRFKKKNTFCVDRRYMLTYIDVYKLLADRIGPVQRSVLKKKKRKNRAQEEIPKILPHDSMSIKCTIKLYYYWWDRNAKMSACTSWSACLRAYVCVWERESERNRGFNTEMCNWII